MNPNPAGDGKSPIRVGILGAGAIAEVHIRALKSLPGIDVVAVADRDYAKAQDFQRRHGLAAAFDSAQSMTERPLDVVHVLTPPAAHAAASMECLELGWNIFVEKPFATSIDECHSVKRVADTSGRIIGVNHNLTFTPCYTELLDAIRQCRLGKIEHVAALYNFPLRQLAAGQTDHWMFREPGNIVLEVGPHPLSTVQRLLGAVETVTTTVSGRHTLNSGLQFYDTWQSSMILERGTAQFFLSVGREYRDGCLYVLGQDGAACLDLLRNTITITEKSRFSPPVDDLRVTMSNARSMLGGGIRTFRTFVKGFLGSKSDGNAYYIGMRESIRAFYRAFQLKESPPVGLADGIMVIETCEAIIRSGEEFLMQCDPLARRGDATTK